jgi:hypothetical protein
VDQPFVEVDEREVDKMLMFHFSTMAWSHSCHTALFYKPKQQQLALQEKRTINDDLQYIQRKEGTEFPKD